LGLQAAFSTVLVIGGLLVGRGFVHLLHVDKGYDATHVVTARVPVPSGPNAAERNRALLAGVLERLQPVPGLVAAGGKMLPFAGATYTTGVGLHWTSLAACA